MMQKRRSYRWRRSLNVEALEDRMVLSGVVYAGEDPTTGMINIIGDGGNNAITIQPVALNVLRISGDVTLPTPTSPPSVTSVDGVTFRDYFLNTVSGFNIQMLNGNNRVTMAGLSIPGNITINAGAGHDTFSFDSIQTNAGNISVTAAGLGSDTVTLTNSVVGAATIQAGAGVDQISLDSDSIGTVSINTATSTAKDNISISNSMGDSNRPGIGMLMVQAGNGDNTISVTNTTMLATSLTTGNGNNTLSLDSSSMVSGRVTAGTGSNSVDVSNDAFSGPAGLSVRVGVGGSAVQAVQLSNDSFSGGALTVTVGDGVPYFSPNPAPTGSLLPASSFAMINDMGIGTTKITLGQFFGSVISYGTANTLSLSVGDNADLVHINTSVARDETITVGNAATYPVPPLPTPTVLIDGAVGGLGSAQTLQVQIGDGWILTADPIVSGDEDITAGNADTIAVSSPNVGGDLNITTGDNAPSLMVTDVMSNDLNIQAGNGGTYFYLNNDTVNNNLNFTSGDGDSSLALMNVNVGLSLSVNCGAGVHDLAAENTTCLFGQINAGSGPANTFEDLGGNFGFIVMGVSGIAAGPFPPTFDASNLSLDTSTVNQGDTATLTGTFTQLGIQDSHTVTIDWGDGSAPTVIDLDPGVYTFSAPHQYLDDSPDGSSTVADTISVTVKNSIGDTASATTPILVNDVPPNITPDSLQLSASTINEGGSVALSGNFSNPGVQDTHQVLINWGDGSTPTTLQLVAGEQSFGPINHAYLESLPGDAPYTIQVTVTDEGGASSTASTQITVNNVAPSNINLSLTNATPNEGNTTTLNGTFTDPGVLDTHTVVINWGDGSNTTLTLAAGAAAFSANHQYQQNLPGDAPYTIQATVSDEDNASGTASTQVTVSNVAPSNLNLNFANAGINEGDAATLNGTFTDPGALDTHTVVINWGDGSANTILNLPAGVLNFNANHPYLQNLPGDAPYTARVTVSDEDNASTSAGMQLTVHNVAPGNLTLDLAKAAINEGDTATLNGTFTDPGVLDTHTVVINWGDGSLDTTVNLPAGVLHFNANHAYLDNLPGNAPYAAQVTVTDEDNASTSASTQLTVNNVAPANVHLSFANATVNVGDIATLNGTFTDPGVLDTHTVVIDWGDGSLDTTLSLDADALNFSAAHQYRQALSGNASYTVQATVIDKDKGSGSGNTQITVNNNNLLSNLQLGLAGDTLNEGDTATLNGTFTDTATQDTHTVVINWGDGSANTTLNLAAGVQRFNANHPYETVPPDNAPFAIQVTVNNSEDASISATTQATVQNPPPANINLSFANGTITAGDTATLNGTFTDTATQDTHTVVINWGDGSANTTLNLAAGVLNFSAQHPYLGSSSSGVPYSAQVTISDEDNATASASATLLVNAVAPIANAGADRTVAEGTGVTLNGTFIDLNTQVGRTFQWTVTSSNGQVLPAGNGPSFSFTPKDDGTYTATFTVTDSNGAVGTSKVTVTATRVPPALVISGVANVNEGSPYTLNLNGQETGADTIMSWTVTWGDGAVQTLTGNPGSATHVYTTGSSHYTISARATDEDGTYAAASTVAVNVVAVQPTLMLS
ncbi:MAG TPA: PKD domain-containing protein, partial [Gemmataceae bacterium]|nr:PKD domain-containing protein [Gemmataceae bacterium]